MLDPKIIKIGLCFQACVSLCSFAGCWSLLVPLGGPTDSRMRLYYNKTIMSEKPYFPTYTTPRVTKRHLWLPKCSLKRSSKPPQHDTKTDTKSNADFNTINDSKRLPKSTPKLLKNQPVWPQGVFNCGCPNLLRKTKLSRAKIGPKAAQTDPKGTTKTIKWTPIC